MLKENSLQEKPNQSDPSLFSRDFFRSTCEYTTVGPVTFLPMMEPPSPGKIKYSGSGKLEEQTWLGHPLRDLALYPQSLGLAIDSAYHEYYSKGFSDETPLPEPEWLTQLDPNTKSMLRRNRAFFEGMEKGFLLSGRSFEKIFGFTCFLDLEKESGVFKGLEDNLWLWRLRHIRQLAWLTVPAGPGELQDTFPHDRYFHSCNVLAVASLIGHNIGLSEKDMTTLQMAAYTHDVLTPAGGDRTKAIDPNLFDEDLHFPDAFDLYPNRPFPTFSTRKDWADTEKLIPDKQALIETVGGKGLLGHILDIADKLSYVGADAGAYINETIRYPTCFEDPDYKEIESIVKRALDTGSLSCSPWPDVKSENNKIYFSSPSRLAEFLKLRALMFKNLYYNPKARNVEHVLASIMARVLYQKGVLDREKLLTMNDYDLESLMENHLWGSDTMGGFRLLQFRKLYPEITLCNSVQDVREKLITLQDKNLTLVERFHGTTSTGEHFLTKKDGNIIPFSQACPKETKELKEIFQSRDGYVIYSVPFSELSIQKEAEEDLRNCQANQEIK